METLIIAIIIIEIIKTVIDFSMMKKRHQRNEVLLKNIGDNYKYFAEFQERLLRLFAPETQTR